ncbi:hypothetical protein GCM10028791_25870 [Echinicola sediminis]
MKHNLKPTLTIMIISLSFLASSCQEFLDVKPRKDIVVPRTLEDVQALLDNTNTFNNSPSIGLWASDDLVTNDQGFMGFREDWVRMAHTWDNQIFSNPEDGQAWNKPYQQILYANIALETLAGMEISEAEEEQAARIRGTALYYRASAYFVLCQLFAPAYGTENALGVPLKRETDVNRWEKRPGLEENYQQMLADLEESLSLLPDNTIYWTRPSLQAAHGLLSRIYLAMGDYTAAETHASTALDLGGELLLLAEVKKSLDMPLPPYFYPIPRGNREVLFYEAIFSVSDLYSPNLMVASELISLYEEGDLRKELYFYPNEQTGGYNFIGNYTGDYLFFSGLTVSELLLTKMECLARRGALEEGQGIFNSWLLTRYEEGSFQPRNVPGADEFLEAVLRERRKEMVGRGLNRWMDLRRLNSDPRFAKTIIRKVNDKEYRLVPNDARYTFPIPANELQLNDLVQNP